MPGLNQDFGSVCGTTKLEGLLWRRGEHMRDEKGQAVDAILFSAKPNMVDVEDPRRHLADHKEVYWTVGFPISSKHNFSYPIYGFIHIGGGQVEYRATIRDIIPFSPRHFEDESLARQVKPEPWIRQWKDNVGGFRSHPWKNVFIITEIVPFKYDTYEFEKCDGTKVRKPPENYIRVHSPDRIMQTRPQVLPNERKRLANGVSLAERNLEDFIVQHLDAVEPGLQLVERQLSTPTGRLDLLCKDPGGCHVIVELKRMQSSDEVVGQLLRYMGWFKAAHPKDKVRGIVVVGRQDHALSYAASAVPDVKVKEFKFQIVDASVPTVKDAAAKA
jgi:hypothetical protein